MSETIYDRAAAAWVSRQLGCDPTEISAVDFDIQDGYAISEVTFEASELTLTFFDCTPGDFIRECVELTRAIP